LKNNDFFTQNDGIPLGLGMALSQNGEAMTFFVNLSDTEKQNIIDRTHDIKSKDEMRQFVDTLA